MSSSDPFSADDTVRIYVVVKKRIVRWVESEYPAWVALIALSVFAGVIELGYARYSASTNHVGFFGTASYLLSISLASMICGVFFGFLFGIPRTLTGGTAVAPAGPEASGGDTAEGRGSQPRSAHLGTNTNLEQISDWLTKIMVGVGLTQISRLPHALRVLAGWLQPGLGNAAGARALGVLIVIFFSVCGFLIGYLWTRIHLTKAFRNAERDTLDTLEAKVTTMQAQPDKDAEALSLAQKILDPTVGDRRVPYEELAKAVRESSPALKVELFYMARKFRKERKDDPKKKAEIAKVLPIFQALTSCDESDRFHRTHAQLAYALFEQAQPQYENAVDEITRAIRIRNDGKDGGYLNYESFRSLCNMERMKLATDDRTRLELREVIFADLRFAAKGDPDFLKDPRVREWMAQQKMADLSLQAV